jgi:hypothetical protein
MRKYGLSVFFLVVLAIAITLACGSFPSERILTVDEPQPPDRRCPEWPSSRPRVTSTSSPRRLHSLRLIGACATNELPLSQ